MIGLNGLTSESGRDGSVVCCKVVVRPENMYPTRIKEYTDATGGIGVELDIVEATVRAA